MALWISLVVAGVVLLWASLRAMTRRDPGAYSKRNLHIIAISLVAGSLFLLVGLIGVFAS